MAPAFERVAAILSIRAYPRRRKLAAAGLLLRRHPPYGVADVIGNEERAGAVDGDADRPAPSNERERPELLFAVLHDDEC